MSSESSSLQKPIKLKSKYSKSAQIEQLISEKENILKYKKLFWILIIILIVLFIIAVLVIIILFFSDKRKYFINFNYKDYESYLISDKIKKDSGWFIMEEEAYFINGIIRKFKMKNYLEIGVASGGTSILILNAIQDIEDSVLISLDLNENMFTDQINKTGYRVKEYFPELTNKWKLYTGDQPHKFLNKLNMKFDFLFLDTAHVAPGEIINFIEALPFLNDNAVVIVHDLLWHFYNINVFKNKFYTSTINLIPALYGDKILVKTYNDDMTNIGAVILYPNQEEHYLDYFLLLFNFWEYMPNDQHINDLRIFIKEYYKKEKYLTLFNSAVNFNNNSINIFKEQPNYDLNKTKEILLNLGKNNNNDKNV